MKTLAWFGWAVAAFGGYAALMVLTHLGEQTTTDATIRFLFSGALALAGVVVARRAWRLSRPAELDAAEAERHVLTVARAHNGRVTATEIAAESPVPLAQASDMLDSLARLGACRMAVAEAGILVFEFADFVGPREATEDVAMASQATPRATQRTDS